MCHHQMSARPGLNCIPKLPTFKKGPVLLQLVPFVLSRLLPNGNAIRDHNCVKAKEVRPKFTMRKRT